MGIESRDINDKEILEKTRQGNDKNGNVQFRITLPSGREVNSEWISPDNQKGAVIAWVEAIRDQMVADAEEVRAKVRRQVQEREAAERRAAAEQAALTQPPAVAGTAGFSGTPVTAPAPIPGPSFAMPAPGASPVEYARQQLANAQAAVQHYQMALMQAQVALQQASMQAQMWQQMLAGFEGNTSGLQQGFAQGGVIQHAQNIGGVIGGSGDTGGRRGRPKGSKNKPKAGDDGNGSPGGLIIGGS